MTFWSKLQKPFAVLAPMADVTDAAFRKLIAKYSEHERADGSIGGPDATWTEFVSADGLVLAPSEGKEKLLSDLVYSEEERPIVAQLFSSIPENMEKAARLCRELGFDGIDINMGCPDRSIEKQGAGAAMIRDPKNTKEVIAAAKAGAARLPVSVKTRLGYNSDELETWLPELLSTGLTAVIVHTRTRKEMSKVPAHWDRLTRAVEIRNERAPGTLIVGNGDIHDVAHARALAAETGADGMMLGRAIFGNPWLFHPKKDLSNVSLIERLDVMLEHTELFEKLLPHKHFAIMKKHYKAYVSDFDGAKELRVRLMEAQNARDVRTVVHKYTEQTPSQILDSSATLYS